MPVQRSEDGCDMRRFRSFNHSTCKTVLNLLEAVYLRLRKIVVKRITVVKFRMDNRGSDPFPALMRAATFSLPKCASCLCTVLQ